jgi:DNA-binding IclR family transcriptional regulator
MAQPGGLDPRSVLGKVSLIVETLAADGGRMGLSELARRSGVAKPSVHRLCADLVAWGLVERVGDGFRLGPKLFELGQRVPVVRGLRDVALPYLEQVFVATKQTVHLAVLDGHDVLYVDKLAGLDSVAVPSTVAGRLPLHCTATGKCLLAFGDPALVESVVADGLVPRTPFTIVTRTRLEEDLAQIRAGGHAVEREECVSGLASLAAPIFGWRGLLGALSITTSVARLDEARLAPPVRDAAMALTRKLGGGVWGGER